MTKIYLVILYLILAPVIGGLVSGIDRIVTARMQRRVGPPVLQPFYDVMKLFSKQAQTVHMIQNLYVAGFLIFTVVAGMFFFAGSDLLLIVFILTVGGVFLVVGAYSVNSPYSNIGAERELLQMMSYEPILILVAIGMYIVTGSFHVRDIAGTAKNIIYYLPGVFIGFLFILTIKLRKSPFDLSTSHHGHQEIVKGLTTEFSGPALACIEIAHWYENIILLSLIYLFFATKPFVGVAAVIIAYLLELVIDNTYARLSWKVMFKYSWIIAATLVSINLIVVYYILMR